jgi:hypothetical protein
MSQSPAPASAEQLALATRLVEVMRVGEDFRKIIESQLADTSFRESAVGEGLAKMFRDTDRRASIAEGFAKRLSVADLKELIEFFESPLGTRFLDARSALSTEQRASVTGSVMKTAEDIKRRILGDLPPDEPWKS